MKQLLDRIQELFFEGLEKKTGWGKNDVRSLYKDCVNQALKEYLQAIDEA